MVVSHLVNGMDRSRYEARLIVLDNARIDVPISEDVRLDRIPVRPFAPAVFGLARLLRRDPPDILIAHMSLPGVWAIIARRLAFRRLPVVVVEHNMPTIEYAHDDTPRRRLIPFLMRRTYRRADALVSISTAAATDLEGLLGVRPGTVRTIENPTVPEGLEARANEPPEHPWVRDSSAQVIVAVGRLTPQKDFDLLIRSFALVVSENCRARLVIFGEGPEREALEGLVRELGLQGSVDLPGVTANPYSAMRHSTVFAMSSAYEGAPLVAIEAVACGTRVVATDVGFLRDFLDATAGDVLVETRTSRAFADALLKVLGALPACGGGSDRVAPYRVATAVAAYERLIDELA